MTCKACESAEQNLTSGLYESDCDQCKVRAVANGRELHDAIQAGTITPEYEQVMQRMFGDDWEATAHARVKAWKKRIKAGSAA